MAVKAKKKTGNMLLMGLLIILAAAAAVVLLRYHTTELFPPAGTVSPETTAPTVPRSEFTAGDFAFQGDYLTCLTADSMVGIDVSGHQKQIDWAQVKAAGVDFVFVRLGYRGYVTGDLNEDQYARTNLQGARDAGLLVGAYFYSQAVSAEEAEQEARFAMEILGDFRLDLPLAFDWEITQRTREVPRDTATRCAQVFCGEVERGGSGGMIYFSSYQAQVSFDLLQLTDWPWWLAVYNTGAQFPCRFAIWQYSCTGTVPGIETVVDLNVMIVE